MRSTHPFEQEEVMAYLDGEITVDRATEIALHLQRCAECQDLAACLRNLSHQFTEWEIESAPARLTEQMTEEITKEPRSQTRTSPADLTPLKRLYCAIQSRRSGSIGWALAGTLAVLLILMFGTHYQMSLEKARGLANTTDNDEGLTGLVASRDGVLVPKSAAGGGSGGRHGTIDGAVGDAEVKERQALQQRAEKARIASSLEKEQTRQSTAQPAGMPGPPPPPSSSPASAPMIARTATLSIVVKNFAGVEAAVKGLVLRHSGYIGELNTSTPPDAAKTFSATLRVPSGRMEAALAELKQLGLSERETQGGEEVTKQYTDLAARLKNSRATEERLLGVLRNNTGKVKDVLEVENEISRVRGEIEEMEADQRALQSRIDFATITLSVTEEYKASLNAPPSSMGTRLHNSFVEGYHNVSESLIGLLAWLLEAGPMLLLWAAILFFPARWAWKRIRRALTATPKPAAA